MCIGGKGVHSYGHCVMVLDPKKTNLPDLPSFEDISDKLVPSSSTTATANVDRNGKPSGTAKTMSNPAVGVDEAPCIVLRMKVSDAEHNINSNEDAQALNNTGTKCDSSVSLMEPKSGLISSPSVSSAVKRTSVRSASSRRAVDTVCWETPSGQETPSSPNQNRLNFTRRKYQRKVPIPSARDEATVSELLPFQCEICGKRLERARTLMLHKRAVHEGYRPFACEFCSARFTQNGHLKQHIEAVHKGSRPYGCKLCHRRFSTPRSAKEHRCDRKARRPAFGCGLCAARFREGVDLREHRLRVHADEKTFDCSVCGAPFRTETELADHRASRHELKRPHVCELCGKSFTQPNKLLHHKSAVHEGKRPYTCDICGSAFTQLVHLKLHKNSIHEGKKPYKCDACFRSFSQSGHLRVHKCVADRAAPSYVCDICNKRFPQMNTLKKHIASVHEKLRPFPCNLCSGAFRDATELRRHHRHVHSGKEARKCPFCHFQCHRPAEMHAHRLILHSGARLRKCRYCRSTFSTVSELKKHLSDVHPAIQHRCRCKQCKQRFDTMPELRQHQLEAHPVRKKYGCDQCEATFSTKRLLRRHTSESHPIPNDHTCAICGERFSRVNVLTRHMTVAHTDQKLICSQCGLRFFTVMALRKHERNSHENIGPHACEVCGERFRYKGHLKRHHNKVHVAKLARASVSNGNVNVPTAPNTSTDATSPTRVTRSPPIVAPTSTASINQQSSNLPNFATPTAASSSECLSSKPEDPSFEHKRRRGRPQKSLGLESATPVSVVPTVPTLDSVSIPNTVHLDNLSTSNVANAPHTPEPLSIPSFLHPMQQQPLPLRSNPLSQMGPWFPLCPMPFPSPSTSLNPLLGPFSHLSDPTASQPSAAEFATTLALLSAISGSPVLTPPFPMPTTAPPVFPSDMLTVGTTAENTSTVDNIGSQLDKEAQDLSVFSDRYVIKQSSSAESSPKPNEKPEPLVAADIKLEPRIS